MRANTHGDPTNDESATGAKIVSLWPADVRAIQRIELIPRILETACLVSGMRFATIGRVTPDQWICCAVHDDIGFGIMPGTELALESTLCRSMPDARQPIAIDEVACSPEFADHPLPKLIRFQRSLSMPIVLRDQSLFGSLCALDDKPGSVNQPELVESFRLFAHLIASQIDLARLQEGKVSRPIGE
jgi:GAF domain-containing protein